MTLIFADVSEFQTVDWATYGAKYPAVIVRAHNGWRADYKWPQNRDGSRKHCKWRGFYQYLPASVDPRVAARRFAATTGKLLPGEVAILDLEEGTGDQRARRAAWLDELDAAVEWTYSGLYFSRTHLPGVRLDWVAAYQSTDPTPKDTTDLWQHSSSATFPGIPGKVDSNKFNGTLADLQALTAQEDDMPTADEIAQKILGYKNPDVNGDKDLYQVITDGSLARDDVDAPGHPTTGNTHWTTDSYTYETFASVSRVYALLQSIAGKVGVDVDEAALAGQLAAQLAPQLKAIVADAAAAGGTPEQIAQAVVDKLGAALTTPKETQ